MVETRYQSRLIPLASNVLKTQAYVKSLIRFLCLKHKFIFIRSFDSPRKIAKELRKNPWKLLDIFITNFTDIYTNDGLCKVKAHSIARVLESIFCKYRYMRENHPICNIIVLYLLTKEDISTCCNYDIKMPELSNEIYEHKLKMEKEQDEREKREYEEYLKTQAFPSSSPMTNIFFPILE